jgi:hypothetical protein
MDVPEIAGTNFADAEARKMSSDNKEKGLPIAAAITIKVVCYSGYRAEESPVRFYLGERKIEVEAIIDRWLAPDHRYFKVRGDDKALYIIRHDSVKDTWELTMFDMTGT